MPGLRVFEHQRAFLTKVDQAILSAGRSIVSNDLEPLLRGLHEWGTKGGEALQRACLVTLDGLGAAADKDIGRNVHLVAPTCIQGLTGDKRTVGQAWKTMSTWAAHTGPAPFLRALGSTKAPEPAVLHFFAWLDPSIETEKDFVLTGTTEYLRLLDPTSANDLPILLQNVAVSLSSKTVKLRKGGEALLRKMRTAWPEEVKTATKRLDSPLRKTVEELDRPVRSEAAAAAAAREPVVRVRHDRRGDPTSTATSVTAPSVAAAPTPAVVFKWRKPPTESIREKRLKNLADLASRLLAPGVDLDTELRKVESTARRSFPDDAAEQLIRPSVAAPEFNWCAVLATNSDLALESDLFLRLWALRAINGDSARAAEMLSVLNDIWLTSPPQGAEIGFMIKIIMGRTVTPAGPLPDEVSIEALPLLRQLVIIGAPGVSETLRSVLLARQDWSRSDLGSRILLDCGAAEVVKAEGVQVFEFPLGDEIAATAFAFEAQGSQSSAVHSEFAAQFEKSMAQPGHPSWNWMLVNAMREKRDVRLVKAVIPMIAAASPVFLIDVITALETVVKRLGAGDRLEILRNIFQLVLDSWPRLDSTSLISKAARKALENLIGHLEFDGRECDEVLRLTITSMSTSDDEPLPHIHKRILSFWAARASSLSAREKQRISALVDEVRQQALSTGPSSWAYNPWNTMVMEFLKAFATPEPPPSRVRPERAFDDETPVTVAVGRQRAHVVSAEPPRGADPLHDRRRPASMSPNPAALRGDPPIPSPAAFVTDTNEAKVAATVKARRPQRQRAAPEPVPDAIYRPTPAIDELWSRVAQDQPLHAETQPRRPAPRPRDEEPPPRATFTERTPVAEPPPPEPLAATPTLAASSAPPETPLVRPSLEAPASDRPKSKWRALARGSDRPGEKIEPRAETPSTKPKMSWRRVADAPSSGPSGDGGTPA
jgi:hypothetical protein